MCRVHHQTPSLNPRKLVHRQEAPTTAALRVNELIQLGYVVETGPGQSQIGRRPRGVGINASYGMVAGVDLGAKHASFGLFDLQGRLISERHTALDITQGPDPVLNEVARQIRNLVETSSERLRLLGVGMGLPGPVSFPGGKMVSPARMPGWNGVEAGALLREILGVPVFVDNDANLMALGEHLIRGEDADDFIFVKAGSSIGGGVIAGGRIHHGYRGMAGDISHVSVPDAPATLCSCGRTGCLDAVAGGAAIVKVLHSAGEAVTDTPDLIRLAANGHPVATQLLREAGNRTGVVLSSIVNFFNPRRVVLGGTLSEAESFISGVQSAIYTECQPFATDSLEIEATKAKKTGGITGSARLALDRILDPARITAAVNASTRK